MIAIPHREEKITFLRSRFSLLEKDSWEQIVQGLLAQVIDLMRKDAGRSIEAADLLLEFAALTGEPLHRAVGLRAKAQAIGNGLGAYRESIPLFEEAIEIHRNFQDEYGEALVCLTYIWALAHVGRTPEALARGAWALNVLRGRDDKPKLAALLNNLGLVQNRAGEYAMANETFAQAIQLHRELGGDWLKTMAVIENNRALALFGMGEISLATNLARQALQLAEAYGLTAVLARGLHTLSALLFFQGKFNEALQMNDQAIELHQRLDQPHEIALCKLSKTDCLLELRQFPEVIKLCEELIPIFREIHFSIELAETIRNQASALVGLKRYAPAIEALEEARQIFLQEKHLLRAAYAHLQTAICYRQQKRISESIEIALNCADTFDQHSLPMDASLARLLAGWGYLSEGKLAQAETLAADLETALQIHHWPRVAHQVFHLKGQLARLQGAQLDAVEQLTLAVTELEKLRGNAMIEHRVNFVEDKQAVYETLVQLWVEQGELQKGLEYVERAKSRTLVELVTAHADAHLETHTGETDPLLLQLQALRTAREQKLRYTLRVLESSDPQSPPDVSNLQHEVQTLENQITDLWHQLLIRNQPKRDSGESGEVNLQDIRPFLDAETVLVEYFVTDNQLLAFTLENTSAQESVQVFPLSVKMSQVKPLLTHLNLNFKLVAAHPGGDDTLLQQAQAYLHRLYQMLVLPLEPTLRRFKKIIFVPFDTLHAVPFHALYDSRQYLIENYQISYLPAATLLRYCKETHIKTTGKLIIGHSFQGKLPYAVKEAQRVAEIWGVTAYCEEQARISDLRPQISEARLIHIACHATYYDDNSLFSGLMLEDGYLTTLDVFGLQLNASLVTLSACQTGRSKIGGGDELLGLVRAFFAAGTASMLTTLWPVADQSTIDWMERFYTFVKQGQTKGEAIQNAQLAFLRHNELPEDYRHPFFWAPFSLIGDTEKL
ncbi:MAG TPA: CHAT domain-containing protein [Anaerolineales bacterium]|nr:CHAT domain-containing protein [Anaerolineales bacterium]